MEIDKGLITKFEQELDPANPSGSTIKSSILGYGEISAIFELDHMQGVALKRLPLFDSMEAAEKYESDYKFYCENLRSSGLILPEDNTLIIQLPGKPVILYIAQQKFPSGEICNKMLHEKDDAFNLSMIESIIVSIAQVWKYNEGTSDLQLALDGQISNWVFHKMEDRSELFYIDTSTPLHKKQDVEQLDPELFLKSAPSFLRWIIRKFFLKDVMDRYYVQRLVYVDLLANLNKENKSDLILPVIDIVNEQLKNDKPVTQKEIASYYKEDKLIWQLFLSFRRFDRWMTTRLFRKKYEFMLPGKINR
jgi:hypothetical protein